MKLKYRVFILLYWLASLLFTPFLVILEVYALNATLKELEKCGFYL